MNSISSDEEMIEQNNLSGRSRSRTNLLNADSSDEDEESGNFNGASKRPEISPPEKSDLNAESSDEEDSVNGITHELTKAQRNRIVDSSDDEIVVEDLRNVSHRSTINPPGEKEVNSKQSLDADSSDEEVNRSCSQNKEENSSDEEVGRSCGQNNEENSSGCEIESGTEESVLGGTPEGRSGKSRKSKASALNDIRSESQRLMRESSVGLPYHRPKQRTLEDFLNRKKGTPDIIQSAKDNHLDLKNEKTILERQRLVEDFYRMDEPESQETEETANFGDQEALQGEDAGKEDLDCANDTDLTEGGDHVGTVHVEEEKKSSAEDNDASNSRNQVTSNSDSLNLLLEETPTIEIAKNNDFNEISNKKMKKLEALKNQIDNELLEKSLQITPTLGSGNLKDDELFSPTIEISDGAQKLMKRFVVHAQTPDRQNDKKEIINELNVVKKILDSSGNEMLNLEKIELNNEINKIEPQKKMSYLDHKRQLRKKMFEKKVSEFKKKEELIKLTNEENEEDVPNIEEEFSDECSVNSVIGEESEQETESEPEEDDIDMREKKGRRGIFVDDEAEESGQEADEESEDDSDEDDRNVDNDHSESFNFGEGEDTFDKQKKKNYNKIKNIDFLSDDSNSKLTETKEKECEVDTPFNETSSVQSVAGSNHSSASSILFNSAPRWTPFKDRIDANEIELAPMEQNTSPSYSELAKKRLGFEGLFDGTDPDMEDISDVVNLCSGKFASQPEGGQNEDHEKWTRTPGIESQDTVILTGNEQSRTQRDEVIAEVESNLGAHDHGGETLEGEEESMSVRIVKGSNGVTRLIDSSDDEMDSIKSIKRKRKMISDDEDSSVVGEEEVNEEKEESNVKNDEGLFDKKGRLRKDFFENEAELSGSEDDLSEDEDEKGLDRLELEEGDFDDINESEERTKVGRIHQRVLLDEDQAEIRLFQERFLEDGDLHADYKRQRQFRWKGLDDDMEISKRDSDDDENEAGDMEESWRIQRLEREKWLKDNQDAPKVADVVTDSDFFSKATKAMVRKADPEGLSRDRKSISALSQSGPLQPLDIMNRDQRSSFLSRSSTSLEMMAVYTKKTDDRSGSGAKKSAGNFVFAAVTPEKPGQEITEQVEPVKTNKSVPKKMKLDRTLQSTNQASIFNLL